MDFLGFEQSWCTKKLININRRLQSDQYSFDRYLRLAVRMLMSRSAMIAGSNLDCFYQPISSVMLCVLTAVFLLAVLFLLSRDEQISTKSHAGVRLAKQGLTVVAIPKDSCCSLYR